MFQKPITIILFTILITSGASAPLSAAENAYDVVGKAFLPWVDLLLPQPSRKARALLLRMHLGDSMGTPAALADASVTIYLQVPDKLRIEGSVAGEKIIICRKGQQIWAWPGSKIEALIAQAGALPPEKSATQLRDFQIPLTPSQAAFLPALLTVKDDGVSYFCDTSCRKLEVEVIPEIAANIDFDDWRARLWIGVSDYKIRKLDLRSSDWQGTVILDEVQFLPYLKPEAWVPGNLKNDIIRLSATRFNQLTKALFAK